jgi:hypothetical protein
LYEREPAVAFGDDVPEMYERCAEMWKAFDDEPLDLDRVDKKIFIRMINDEFKEVYDKYRDEKNSKDS